MSNKYPFTLFVTFGLILYVRGLPYGCCNGQNYAAPMNYQYPTYQYPLAYQLPYQYPSYHYVQPQMSAYSNYQQPQWPSNYGAYQFTKPYTSGRMKTARRTKIRTRNKPIQRVEVPDFNDGDEIIYEETFKTLPKFDNRRTVVFVKRPNTINRAPIKDVTLTKHHNETVKIVSKSVSDGIETKTETVKITESFGDTEDDHNITETHEPVGESGINLSVSSGTDIDEKDEPSVPGDSSKVEEETPEVKVDETEEGAGETIETSTDETPEDVAEIPEEIDQNNIDEPNIEGGQDGNDGSDDNDNNNEDPEDEGGDDADGDPNDGDDDGNGDEEEGENADEEDDLSV